MTRPSVVRLYEADCFHLASGHTHRWYFCAGSRGYQSWAGDNPASVTWLPLVQRWPSVTVSAAGGSGGSRVAFDDLVFANVLKADARTRWANVLDVTAGSWLRVPLGGRPLDILLTDYLVRGVVEKEVAADAPYASAVTLWSARTGLAVPGRTDLRLPIYDRQLDFDLPVQTRTYGGTGGYDGPTSLKGTLRERTVGWCPMAAPTPLGIIDGYWRWGTNGGQPITAVPRAWAQGFPLAQVAGNPGTGEYAVDLATGIVTTSKTYQDFRVAVRAGPESIGALVAGLALGAGLVSAADVARMDAVPRTVGFFLAAGSGRTHRDLYDKAVGSVPRGRWFIDQLGRLVVTRLPRADTANAVRAYRKSAGIMPGLIPEAATGGGLPAKQAVVLFAENPSPVSQTASEAVSDDVALNTQPWREAPSAEDPVIAAAFGAAARVERLQTALTLRADAEAEAPLWAAEMARPPQPYRMEVADGAPGLWIGDAVTVTDDIAGFTAGATVVITGRTTIDRRGGATLFVER